MNAFFMGQGQLGKLATFVSYKRILENPKLVEHRKFSFLYLGLLSKLANPIKQNLRKPKLTAFKTVGRKRIS